MPDDLYIPGEVYTCIFHNFFRLFIISASLLSKAVAVSSDRCKCKNPRGQYVDIFKASNKQSHRSRSDILHDIDLEIVHVQVVENRVTVMNNVGGLITCSM